MSGILLFDSLCRLIGWMMSTPSIIQVKVLKRLGRCMFYMQLYIKVSFWIANASETCRPWSLHTNLRSSCTTNASHFKCCCSREPSIHCGCSGEHMHLPSEFLLQESKSTHLGKWFNMISIWDSVFVAQAVLKLTIFLQRNVNPQNQGCWGCKLGAPCPV